MSDEIIAEVRATKERLAAQFGFDIQRLVADIRKTEKLSVEQGRKLVATEPGKKPRSPFLKIRFSEP